MPDENFIWLDCSCEEQFLSRNDSASIVKGQVAKVKITFETSAKIADLIVSEESNV